jgi:Skp family chaperone for outer membrane proteins
MNTSFSVILSLAALLPIMATREAGAAPALPIAYVSMQRIAAEASEAKAAAAKFETMRQEKAREVTAKQKAVETAHLLVVQSGGVFQRSRRAQLQADESRQRAELQKLSEQAQVDLQNLQRQLQTTLREKINSIVDKLAKRRGVQLVLNEDSAVVWANPGIDLTTEIISSLNGTASQKDSRP